MSDDGPVIKYGDVYAYLTREMIRQMDDLVFAAFVVNQSDGGRGWPREIEVVPGWRRLCRLRVEVARLRMNARDAVEVLRYGLPVDPYY